LQLLQTDVHQRDQELAQLSAMLRDLKQQKSVGKGKVGPMRATSSTAPRLKRFAQAQAALPALQLAPAALKLSTRGLHGILGGS
jgi:hypothetical protein